MQKEIQPLMQQLKESYEGDPWFGRNMQIILSEINAELAVQKPANNQHSILELLYHIVNWRQFTINRLQGAVKNDLQYFEQNDWQQLDHSDKTLWDKGLQELQSTQQNLLVLLSNMNDEQLNEPVKERSYTNRYLINGIIQHDIYHLGQIAYITKLLTASE
jgi:uncharacterized damage-inducible protein DinB